MADIHLNNIVVTKVIVTPDTRQDDVAGEYLAWMRALQLKVQEGIFAGPSSRAVLEVVLRVAATMDRGKIVIILADGGWKYMSDDHWMAKLPLPSSVVAATAEKVAL